VHRTASQDAYPMTWYPILNISEHRLCNFHEVSDVNLASMANVATEFFGMRRIQASLGETRLRVFVSFCNWSSLIIFDIPMHVVSYTIHPWHPSLMSARQKRGVQSPTYQIFLLSVYHKFDAIVHLIKLPVRDHNLLQSDSVSQSPFGAKHARRDQPQFPEFCLCEGQGQSFHSQSIPTAQHRSPKASA
jgi:hypothetical protein